MKELFLALKEKSSILEVSAAKKTKRGWDIHFTTPVDLERVEYEYEEINKERYEELRKTIIKLNVLEASPSNKKVKREIGRIRRNLRK